MLRVDHDRLSSVVWRSLAIVVLVWVVSSAGGFWAGYQWGQATAYDEILGPWR